jgi:uncharacterized protein (TIGR02284 family)
MTNPQEVIDALNDLLQQNVDARQGYEKARSDVKQSVLESYLTDKVVQRQAFIEAITQEIITLGGSAKRETTVKGSLHHSWIDIKSALSANDEEAVFEECVRGEKNSLKTYNKLLENTSWPASTKTMVLRQRDQIKADLERADAMADALD